MSYSSLAASPARRRLNLDPGVYRWKRLLNGAWVWIAVDRTREPVAIRVVADGQSHAVAVSELADIAGIGVRNLKLISAEASESAPHPVLGPSALAGLMRRALAQRLPARAATAHPSAGSNLRGGNRLTLG